MNEIYDQVHRYLKQLSEGQISPEDAAAWAGPLVVNQSDDSPDPNVWRALDRLAGADFLVGPNEYLHGAEDFADWLTEFESNS